MKQPNSLDAAFLYMETPTTFGHVTGLMIFERPSPDYDPYAAVYAKFASLVGSTIPTGWPTPTSTWTSTSANCAWPDRVSSISWLSR